MRTGNTRPAALILAIAVAISGCDRESAELPFDPDVVTGVFANGVTYYIRHNEKPKGRLELRLIVNAGSLQEDEDQRGLAHLLEHMGFDGTKHFEKKELVNYLESIGMKFGPELNAYTSFDHTAYMLQVPTASNATVETAIMVLRDWAFGINNLDSDIATERKVVIEEWRLGRGARQRIRDRQIPVLFNGSRYASRLPIGTKEVLDTTPPQRVRDFYRDWYRPELMAVAAVGDVDPAAFREQLRAVFEKTPNPPSPRLREKYPVPGHTNTLTIGVADKEMTDSVVSVTVKHPKSTLRTAADYRSNLVRSLAVSVLNQRFAESSRLANPPFLDARAGAGELCLTSDSFNMTASVKDNGILRGLEGIYTEALRAVRFGVTTSELVRAKADRLVAAEKAYRERDTTDSSEWIGHYSGAFVHGHIPVGPERALALHRAILPDVSVADINKAFASMIVPSNRVILASAPEKAGLTMPSDEELLAVLRKVESSSIAAYVDDVVEADLVARPPIPGTVVSRKLQEGLGIHTWTLSNGTKVVLKPTKLKKDQVLLTGFMPGGHSAVPDSAFIPASTADDVVRSCGLGSFSAVQLRKKLAGHVVSGETSISELNEHFDGSCRTEDFPVAMQLLYLGFTAPRADTNAFAAWREEVRTDVANRLARPETVFYDTMAETMYPGQIRRKPLTLDAVEQLDMARSLAIYSDRFASATNLTMFIVGDFDPATVEQSVVKYVGGLPAGCVEKWKDLNIRPATGVVSRTIFAGVDPKSRVTMLYHGPFEWSYRERITAYMLSFILRVRLREQIRETIGGTYSIWVSPEINRYPAPYCMMRVNFGCNPDQVEKLMEAVRTELDRIKREPPDEIYMTKAVQTHIKERETALEKNEFWLNAMEQTAWNGDNIETTILDFEKTVHSITAADIQAAARRLFDTGNSAVFILKPAKDEKK